MTETLSGLAIPHLGHSGLDPFQESNDLPWGHQFQGEPLGMLTASWSQAAGSHMSGMQPLDAHPFDQDNSGYFHLHHIPSPHVGYPISEMGTPSSNGHQEIGESYHNAHQSAMHLYPNHMAGPMQSPQSSIGALSPNQTPLESPPFVTYDTKPQLARLNSAPEPRGLRGAVATNGVHGKLKGSSDDGDDSYEPDLKRGRKRQRIPHTAVERRYRENLNAHLEKLRQAVPPLAARKGPGGGKGEGEGVKPSKCEILHGAIEYIGARDKEMAAKDRRIADLMAENASVRATLEQMQNYIRATSR